jgi:hypothetical protein
VCVRLIHPADNNIWVSAGEERNNVMGQYLYRFTLSGTPLLGNLGVPFGSCWVMTHDGFISLKKITEASSFSLWAMRVDTSGTPLWQTYFNRCTLTDNYYDLNVSSDGAEGLIAAWVDYRYGNNGDIYAQHINADGVLGYRGPFVPVHNDLRIDWAGSREIRLVLPEAGRVRLELFDIMGRSIQTIADRDYFAGEVQISLPALNLPSGLYIINVTSPSGQKALKWVIQK